MVSMFFVVTSESIFVEFFKELQASPSKIRGLTMGQILSSRASWGVVGVSR
jgi:hypothetical protein